MTNHSAVSSHIPLSAREQEILLLLAHDLSIKMIANRLGISYFTVRTHMRQMFLKLQVHTSYGLVGAAVANGYISYPLPPVA